MSAFDEYDQAVHKLLDQLTTKEYRAAHWENGNPAFDGAVAVRTLEESLETAWGGNHPPATAGNWKWRDASSHEPASGEVRLERMIVRLGHSDLWSYQMSTISGLPDRPAKRCAIDLVRHFGDGHFAFVELKLSSDDPFAAAFELLRYFLAYLRARKLGESGAVVGSPDVLKARRIDLVVLAPDSFYVYPPAAGKRMNVEWFARELERGLVQLIAGPPEVSFRFASFPDADEETQARDIVAQFS